MKRIVRAALALALATLLTACAKPDPTPTPTPAPTPVMVTVAMTVTTDNGEGEFISYVLHVPEGTSLFDAMATQSAKAIADDNGVVTSIENMPATESTRWHLAVNGQLTDALAKDIELHEGDEIVWDLH